MTHYDVVVVGGGIHGVGVAQAAAAAGYRVLVLEQSALAAGSSSRSSKLIHGGLRYLESRQFALVHECLQERHRLVRLAPDLVRIAPFHIPIYAETRRRPWLLTAGLSLYALLGGLHRSCRFKRLGRRAWSGLDGLRTEGLQAVFRYYDGMTDDAALTRAVMASAAELGAELALPASFDGAAIEGDRVTVDYREGGAYKQCTAAVLVNAAGAWVNEVLRRVTPQQEARAIEWVQGSHLFLDTRVEAGSYYMEAPQDGRAIFFLPWQGRVMVGTTESRYRGRPEAVAPLPAERDYLLQVVGHYFPHLQGVRVVDAYAGLRVLPADAADPFARPRDTRLHRSAPRVLSIYGGKLTTYRLTAARVLGELAAVLPAPRPYADTAHLVLKPV